MTGKLHSKKQARDWQTAERQMERERLACPASPSVMMTSQAGESPALVRLKARAIREVKVLFRQALSGL